MAEHQSRKSGFLDESTFEDYDYDYDYDDIYEDWWGLYEKYYYYWGESETSHVQSMDKYSHELDFFRRHQGQIYQEIRSCQLYTVSINEYIAPVFTYGFKEAVRALHEASANPDSADSEAAIKKFWRQYGTHYMSKAAMGGSLTVESRWASNAITTRDSAKR